MTIDRSLWLCLIIAILVVLGALFGPAACNALRTQGKQIEVSKGQARAAIDSGAEAMNTVSAVQRSNETTDQTVKDATDELRKTPPGNSNDAAIRAACRMRYYRDSERCARLPQVNPAKPAGPR